VLVPATVMTECVGLDGKEGVGLIRQAAAHGWLEVVADQVIDTDVATFLLDPGESQAIVLARRTNALLLLDEARGRKAASVLSIPHTGTCGMLVLAKRAGLTDRVRPLLECLLSAGYFLADDLVRDTLRLAGES
jgi:predicted nucleic acid-binding protein